MKQRIFSFIISENADILTFENIRFALEGCYPQLKIEDIVELEAVDIDYTDPMDELRKSLAHFGDVWNEQMKKRKKN